jgi:hypothetical protein
MSASIGDYVFNLDSHKVILDTGTSYILLPPDDFLEFRTYIEGAGERSCGFDSGSTKLFYCTCVTDSYSSFPDFEIRLGENSYKIPATAYMSKQ